MNRTILSTLLLSLFCAGVPSSAVHQPETLRVLTYNIHHGEGTDGQFDLPRLAGVITSVSPDLVALQEVDQGTSRASGLRELDELGRLTGLHSAFGKAMDFQGGAYGVGVLSRQPFLRTENLALPGSPDREPRTALTVEVRLPGAGAVIQFTSTHLDQGREAGNKVAQVNYLNEHLAREGRPPSILAGDMNTRRDTAVMQILAERWTDLFLPHEAIESGRIERLVDHVLGRPPEHWRTIESAVVDAPVVSDHQPVLVVLEWVENP